LVETNSTRRLLINTESQYYPPLCPYENMTVYLKPGQKETKVELVDGNIISLPEGSYVMKKKAMSEMCTYTVNVTSKYKTN